MSEMKIKSESLQRLIVKSMILEIWAAHKYADQDSQAAMFLSAGIRQTLDGVFSKEMVAALESAMTGEFVRSVMAELTPDKVEKEIYAVRAVETDKVLDIIGKVKARLSVMEDVRKLFEFLEAPKDGRN